LLQEHIILNEVSILRRIKHPNIVQLIQEFDSKRDLYLVMELVNVSYYRIRSLAVSVFAAGCAEKVLCFQFDSRAFWSMCP